MRARDYVRHGATMQRARRARRPGLGARVCAQRRLTLCEWIRRTLELLGEPVAIVDEEHLHQRVITQAREQFGRDQKVLPGLGAASDRDHLVVDGAFRAWIHALVDLVHEREGRARELGETQ